MRGAQEGITRKRLLSHGALTAAAVVTATLPVAQRAAAAPSPAGQATATVGDTYRPEGTLLFDERFRGPGLDPRTWNPYITDDPSNGWPWNMQAGVAVPSSSDGGPHGFDADYDLPAAVRVDHGLRLRAYRGTRARGYTWTGAIICSRPTDNDFGAGIVNTAGFTFTSGYVEVRAKLPLGLERGMWPAIWFLAAPPASGDEEIDLIEGGFLSGTTGVSRVMACNLHTQGNQQVFVDTGVDLSAAYHRYGMEYRPGESIKMYFDRRLVCVYGSNVPTVPYFIILNLGVASALTSAWHTRVGPATPSPAEMAVSHVQVWSLARAKR